MLDLLGLFSIDAGHLIAGMTAAAAAVALAAQMLTKKARQPQKVKVPVLARKNRRKK